MCDDCLGPRRHNGTMMAVIFQDHGPTFFINMTPGSKAYPRIDPWRCRLRALGKKNFVDRESIIGTRIPPFETAS